MISKLDDEYLIKIVNISSLSLTEHTKLMPLNSDLFDIYISGLSYGIWVSICDIDTISQDDICDLLIDATKRKLN